MNLRELVGWGLVPQRHPEMGAQDYFEAERTFGKCFAYRPRTKLREIRPAINVLRTASTAPTVLKAP